MIPGWKYRAAGTDERAGRDQSGKAAGRDSSSRPTSVHAMPNGSEYGIGRRSV